MTLTRYKDRRNNMKISKIAIAVLFTAGFLTTSASASMATSCAEGYIAVDSVESELAGLSGTCEAIEAFEAVDGDVEVKPIDSCWTTEDGVEACARGAVEPMPTSIDDTPVDDPGCGTITDADGQEAIVCQDSIPEVTSEEGEGILEKGAVDETLMYQSGVATTAGGNDQTASNTLAAFGVLVGALGAFGIAISRERAAK